MEATALEHALTDAERETFERDGILIVEDALPLDLVDELAELCERFDADYRQANGVAADARVSIIDFEGKSGHRVKLDAIPDIRDALDSGSLKVRAWKHPEGLRTMAAEDGVGLIKRVLAGSDRPPTLKKIREALVGRVISSSEWSKWWTRHRNGLKKDPGIGMGGGRDATYFLQDEPSGPIEELTRRLTGLDLKERLKLLRDAVQELDPAEHPELLPFLLTLRQNLLRGDGDVGLRLELLLFLRKLGGDMASGLPPIDSFMKEGEHPAEMVNSIHRHEDQIALIGILEAQSGEDWPRLLMELTLRSVDAPRGYLVRRLVEAGRAGEIDEWAREIQRLPRKEPMYFLWLVKLASSRKYDHVPSLRDLPAIHLFRRAVRVLDDLVVRSEHDDSHRLQVLIKRYRTQLGGRPFTLMDQALEQSGGAQVRELYGVVEGSQGFSTTTRERMLALVLRRYPTLLATDAPVRQSIGDDVIYSTEAGIQRVRKELELLRNEKLPAIYEAIGEAAAMGDLSENYEFTSAIVERENLNRKVLELQSQLDKARPINLSEVDTERASLGTQLRLTNLASGEHESYVILGPWDSQAEEGIISYRAPLGRALLDHPVGAEVDVELPEGRRRYRIDGIEVYTG